MPATKLSDLLIPERWNEYVIERTAAKSALWESGIVVSNDLLDAAVAGGGRIFTMPFFQDLTGASEVISDTVPLSVNRIETENAKAVAFARGKAFGASQLGAALAGTDPLAAIAELLADWWARDMETTLISLLKGFFAAASMATNVVSLPTTPISASVIIDASFRLGDASDKLTCMALNSYTYKELLKLNLITFRKFSEQGEEMPTYLGKAIIVDDSIPITGGGTPTVDTYLFGKGAIAYGEAAPEKSPVETDRDSLLGEDYLITRRKFSLHPVGGSYIGVPTGATPTNAEIETGTNWVRAYENKNVPLVRLVTQVV